MRASNRAIRTLACLALIVGTALTGCSSIVDGDPRPNAQNPTEPNFPTQRPTRTSATPPPRFTPPPKSTPPAGAETLPATNGYVFVETQSGKTRCQISEAEVGCEAPFTNAPQVDGFPANGIRLSANGDEEWIVGNLGDIPVVTLNYRVYTAVGWTIEASEGGTKFVNDTTGRGMFVAIEHVDVF